MTSIGYSGHTEPAVMHSKLTAAPHAATGVTAAPITEALLASLTTLTKHIEALGE